MSEDYTYPTTPTLADLRLRVAELERQLAQDDSNMVALAARNAELCAKLDAIPTADLLFMIDPWADGTPTPERCEAAATAIETWAKAIKAVTA